MPPVPGEKSNEALAGVARIRRPPSPLYGWFDLTLVKFGVPDLGVIVMTVLPGIVPGPTVAVPTALLVELK